MAGEILEAVRQFLPADSIDAMAASAGVDRASARRAAELAVPAVLSGLLLSPNGGARLAAALAAPSPPPEPSGWSGPGQPVGQGSTACLLGGASASALATVLGKCVGAGDGALVGFVDGVTSAVLLALKQVGSKANADAKALASKLKAESDAIATALPEGFSSLLRSRGFYDRLSRSPAPAMAAGEDGAGRAEPKGFRRQARHGRATRAIALSALAALFGVGSYFIADTSDEPAGSFNAAMLGLPAPILAAAGRSGDVDRPDPPTARQHVRFAARALKVALPDAGCSSGDASAQGDCARAGAAVTVQGCIEVQCPP